MDTKNVNGLKVVGSILAIVAAVYFGRKAYKKWKDKKSETEFDTNDNINQVSQSYQGIPLIFGAGAKKISVKDGTDYYLTQIDGGKNSFEFYSNGRFSAKQHPEISKGKYDLKKYNLVAKGNYYLSGKRLQVDGGKSYESDSAFKNMDDLIKNK